MMYNCNYTFDMTYRPIRPADEIYNAKPDV